VVVVLEVEKGGVVDVGGGGGLVDEVVSIWMVVGGRVWRGVVEERW